MIVFHSNWLFFSIPFPMILILIRRQFIFAIILLFFSDIPSHTSVQFVSFMSFTCLFSAPFCFQFDHGQNLQFWTKTPFSLDSVCWQDFGLLLDLLGQSLPDIQCLVKIHVFPQLACNIVYCPVKITKKFTKSSIWCSNTLKITSHKFQFYQSRFP